MDKGHLHLSAIGFLIVGAMLVIWKFLLTNLSLRLVTSPNPTTQEWGAAVSVVA